MENITFEQAMNRLEEIVSALENNQISLEKSVELFQEGIQLTKLCNSRPQIAGSGFSRLMSARASS